MKELLLVGAGFMGTPYLTAAQRLGIRVTLVESETHRDRLAPLVDRFVPVAGTTEEDWAGAAFAAAHAYEPDGVLGFAEPQVVAAALLQDALGMPGPSLHAAVITRNKALQRGCFAVAGLRQPDHLVASDVAAALAWSAGRYPVVVKPLGGSGSAGVVQVPDASTLATVLHERLAYDRVLVETCLDGGEYSWEGLVREGEIIFGNVTARETTGPPEFVGLSHRGGHRFAPADRFGVDTLIRGVVKALRMRTGIVHLEFNMTVDGPAVVEVAARTPGGGIMDVLALTYDFDPFEMLVNMALDLPVALPPRRRPAAYGASWFPRVPAGRIQRVRGLDELSVQPHVTELRLRLDEGGVVEPLRSSAQRVGYVLFRAPTPEALDAAISAARRTLSVDVAAAVPA